MKTKTIAFFSAALLGMSASVALMTGASAATVTKDTIVTQQELANTEKINFSDFDVNKDGRLSRAEVGETLFYIFDTDGNEVIDNIEYERPMVLTIIPMEKKEITTVDFDDDGIPDSTSFNTEEFYEQSMLARFAKDKNGLSAKDFLGQNYWQLDDNKDKTVDIKEFKRAYIQSLRPSAANPNRYND